MASELGRYCMLIKASTFASKWQGESELLVRGVFQVTDYYDAIVFIDEIDKIFGGGQEASEHQQRVTQELMTQFNTDANRLLVAATNFPYRLTDALRRRYSVRIYMPLPTRSDCIVVMNRFRMTVASGHEESVWALSMQLRLPLQ